MKRRWKILIALAGAICAAILLAVIHHYQLRTAADIYIAQLKSEGEPMDLASIVPPPTPPEKNGANAFRQAGALLDTNTSLIATNNGLPAMKMVAPGRAMACWRQPDIRHASGTTNSWQEVAAAIAQNKRAFELLYQITSKPHFDFQIPYYRGMDAIDSPLLELLSELKETEQWLSSAAVYHLHARDTASAVDDVRAMLAITQAAGDDRLVISELVRIAMAKTTVSATWEILQSPSVTDSQLAELQNDWANLDFITNAENALAMERVTGRITLQK